MLLLFVIYIIFNFPSPMLRDLFPYKFEGTKRFLLSSIVFPNLFNYAPREGAKIKGQKLLGAKLKGVEGNKVFAVNLLVNR